MKQDKKGLQEALKRTENSYSLFMQGKLNAEEKDKILKNLYEYAVISMKEAIKNMR